MNRCYAKSLKVLFTIFIISYGVQPAFAEKTASESQNSLSPGCDAASVLAENIMLARQYGLSMSKTMNLATDNNDNEVNKVISTLVVAAYELPRHDSPGMQLRSVEEFRDAAYSLCVKTKTK